MGKTHAATAAVAGLAVAAVADLPVSAVPALAVVGWLSGFAADVDHPSSYAGRLLPPVCWAVRAVSARTVGIAHRGLTHGVLAAAVWGVVVGALSALWLLPVAAVWTGVFAMVGYMAGVLGDVPTKQSLLYVLWPSRVQVRWPRWLRFRTGGLFEHWLFRGLVLCGVLLLPAVGG